jgi:hypothetical protein
MVFALPFEGSFIDTPLHCRQPIRQSSPTWLAP